MKNSKNCTLRYFELVSLYFIFLNILDTIGSFSYNYLKWESWNEKNFIKFYYEWLWPKTRRNIFFFAENINTGLNLKFLLDGLVIDTFMLSTIYKLRISIDHYLKESKYMIKNLAKTYHWAILKLKQIENFIKIYPNHIQSMH